VAFSLKGSSNDDATATSPTAPSVTFSVVVTNCGLSCAVANAEPNAAVAVAVAEGIEALEAEVTVM
jgi:hypothetical protein